MFKISPIQTEELQKKYAEMCGATFCQGFFAYSMINQETGELMGFSQFEIKEGVGYIRDLRTRLGYTDFEAMFILGRATMNFIDMCEVHVCHAAKDAGEEILFKSIGFKFSNEKDLYIADMTGMFDGDCSSHKEG